MAGTYHVLRTGLPKIDRGLCDSETEEDCQNMSRLSRAMKLEVEIDGCSPEKFGTTVPNPIARILQKFQQVFLYVCLSEKHSYENTFWFSWLYRCT